MPVRTPREAVDAFLTPLRQAISCVTNAQLAGGFEPGEIHGLIFRPTESGYIRLSGSPSLRFRLLHQYEVTEGKTGWEVHTRAYTYQLQVADGQEIVIYHYDPRPGSKVKTPHLHVRGLEKPFFLGKVHFPTGRVSLEAVLRCAIEELGVQPQRSDWKAVLEETEGEFQSKKSW